MSSRRTENWLWIIVAVVGLVPVAIAGLWTFMITTATTLHPDPEGVPTTTSTNPVSRWADAVERGRQVVKAGISEQNLPGLSVAVGVDGEIVWAEGFGWADLESQTPVTPQTRFRIGTASVALTSVAAGLLIENDRLKLDDEIQTYVPEFPRKESPVTLRHLMAHVAGIRNDGGDEGPLFTQQCERPVEALPAFAEQPLRFEPGTEYRYSSYGWILMSAAIEAAAGEPFLDFMREHVFNPLGMHETRADFAAAPIPDRATFYFPRFASEPRYGLHGMRPLDYSCYAGASVFLSTPSDLVRFGMAINSGTLLQPATVQVLQTSQQLASGEDTGYGLGWDLEAVALAGEQTRWVGHNGASLGGTVASFITFPERGMAVAIISNISYANTPSLAMNIADAFVQ